MSWIPGFKKKGGRHRLDFYQDIEIPIPNIPGLPSFSLDLDFPSLPPLPDIFLKLEAEFGRIAVQPPDVSIDGISIPQPSLDISLLLGDLAASMGLPGLPSFSLSIDFPSLPPLPDIFLQLEADFGRIAIPPPDVSINGIDIDQPSLDGKLLIGDLAASLKLPGLPSFSLDLDFPELPDFSIDLGFSIDINALINLPNFPNYDATGPLTDAAFRLCIEPEKCPKEESEEE